MMTIRALTLCLGLLASALANAGSDLTLHVGDPAPPLLVMKWLKGTPVPQFEKGHVYVVEFWATWCGPCIESMPHLSELSRQYSGKVSFIGVDVRQGEAASTDVASVQKFVDKKGAKMDYIVAMDDPDKSPVYKTWAVAAGLRPIPSAFIVDGQGRLSWVGSPLSSDFDSAIEQTLHGTLDLAASRASQDKLAADYFRSPAQLAESEAKKKLLNPAVMAYVREDYAGAVREANRIVEQDPSKESDVFGLKFLALLHMNAEEGFAYADGKAQDEAILKTFELTQHAQDYPSIIACMVAGQDKFSKQVYGRVAATLEKHVAAHPEKMTQWRCLAQARDRLNQKGRAIEAQEKAIALYETMPDRQAEGVASMKKTLAEYQAK